MPGENQVKEVDSTDLSNGGEQTEEISQTKKRFFTPVRIVLIGIALLLMQFPGGAFKTMVAPVFSQLTAYLSADIGFVSLIGTVPSLAMILGSFIGGALADKINNKAIALVGLGLFFIGGVAPVFCDNLIVILIWRAVLGIGVGLSRLFAMSWIGYFFKGRTRDTMMGLANAAGGLFSSGASIMGGFLGTISWQAAFWGYSVILIIILIILVVVPDPLTLDRKEAAAQGKTLETQKEDKPKEKNSLKGVPAVAWHYAALLFFEYICVIVMYSIISSHIVAEGWGNSVEAGFAISITGAVMAIVAACFVGITAVLKRWGMPVALLLGALGYLVLFLSDSLITVYIGFGIIGAGMGVSNPTIFNYVIIDCPKSIAMSNALVLSGMTLGQFLSSFFLAGMSAIFASNFYGMFGTCSVVLVAIAVYAILVVRWQNKRVKAAETAQE